MAEYRDEKETLRRRVEELEAELAQLHGDELASAFEAVRAERDRLGEALDRLEVEHEAVRRERDELRQSRAELARELAERRRPTWRTQRRRLLVALVAGGVVSLALGAYLVGLGAEAWVSATAFAMFATCLLGVLGIALPRSTAPTPAVEERVVRSKRAEKRARRRERQKQAVRVATEQHEITVAAKTRRGRRRRGR